MLSRHAARDAGLASPLAVHHIFRRLEGFYAPGSRCKGGNSVVSAKARITRVPAVANITAWAI